jgi:hypothetical protein
MTLNTTSRALLSITLALASVGLGVWFGEDASMLFPTSAVIAALILAAIAVSVSPRSPWIRVGAGLLTIGLFALGWKVGSQRASQAYNACLNDGRQVLTALHAYQSSSGRYPESLAELNIAIPCRRLLRGTLLEYRRRGDGFTLSFSDWLVSHDADETSAGFFANK